MVHADKDAAAEFNRGVGIIPRIDCRRASADIRVALKDGDVDGDGGLGGVVCKMVGCGCAACAST